jgi:hypothetical protein
MSSVQEKIATAVLSRIRKRQAARPTSDTDRQSSSSVMAPAKLREVTFSDFDKVSKLKQRTGIAADSPENWNRLWRDNPALEQGGVKRPIGWVLEAGGEIVGFLGNISLQCRYGDRTLSAVSTHGYAVDTPYRAVAMSLASVYYRQKSVDLFISSSAIEATGKIALAFKAATLPQSDYDTLLFWVIRPYGFARVLVEKLNINSVLTPIASFFTALAIASDKVVRQRWPRQSRSTLAVSEMSPDAIESSFETLWAEKLTERTRLYADRTPAALRWHFYIPGDKGCARVLCCRKGEKLEGYAVVRSDTDDNGLRKSIIADMLVRQDDPAVVQALWVAAYEHAKDVGSHVLEVLGFPSDIRAVSSGWNPYRRKYPACPYYYKATDPVLHKTLSDPEAWYACPFDGDATLIRPSYPASAPQVAVDPIEATQNGVAVGFAETKRGEVV